MPEDEDVMSPPRREQKVRRRLTDGTFELFFADGTQYRVGVTLSVDEFRTFLMRGHLALHPQFNGVQVPAVASQPGSDPPSAADYVERAEQLAIAADRIRGHGGFGASLPPVAVQQLARLFDAAQAADCPGEITRLTAVLARMFLMREEGRVGDSQAHFLVGNRLRYPPPKDTPESYVKLREAIAKALHVSYAARGVEACRNCAEGLRHPPYDRDDLHHADAVLAALDDADDGTTAQPTPRQ
jgi:hypothetical protein